MNCQDNLYRGLQPKQVTRRWFFEQCGVGLGSIALSQLMADAAPAPADPLAPKAPPFAPKAKRVIFLFMAGAPSHLELFDNKPQLSKFDGTLPPADLLKGYRAAFINPNSKLLGPRFKFAKYGQSGTEVSELLPHFTSIVDDVAIVKSMATDAFNHAPGQLLMNTGTMQFGRPSMGAWVLYGLGSQTKDLPGFVVFSSGTKGPSGGDSCWGSGFLPTFYQGVQLRTGGDPVPLPLQPARRRSPHAARIARRHRRTQPHAPGRHRRPGNRHPHQLLRNGRSACKPWRPTSWTSPRNRRRRWNSTAPNPAKASYANNCLLARRLIEKGCPLRAALSRSLGPALQPGEGPGEELPGHPTAPPPRWSRT